MNEEMFWKIIEMFDWDKIGDNDGMLAPAVAYLESLAVDDIHAFEELLSHKLHVLDTEAHAKNIGEYAYVDEETFFSVDTFLYARCVVVANGCEYFNMVIQKPNEMPKDMEFEPILYLASTAYENKTGEPFERASKWDYETYSNKQGWTSH